MHRAEQKRLPFLESAISTLREQKLKAQDLGLLHAEQIHNVGLYLLLMDRDFSVLRVAMVSSYESWHLRYTARQMGLLIYEVCDDLSGMLGKTFRDSLIAVETNNGEMDKFNQIKKRLNDFRTSNHDFLYRIIRNLVAAHRTQDSVLFLQTVEDLDFKKVFQLGAEFYEIIQQLIGFLIKTTTKLGEAKIALQQLLASEKFLNSLNSDDHPKS